MKSPTFLMFPLLLTSFVCVSVCKSWAADQTNSTAKPIFQEDLGYDFYNGKSNKIERVSNETPVAVWVIYEGGKSGRNIPRAELPPQLRAKYPYNSQDAAKYIQDKAQEAQTRNAVQKRAWELKERDLQAKVEALDREWIVKQRDINAVRQQRAVAPNNRVLKRKEIALIEEKKEIGERRQSLQEQLKQVRAQIDKMP